MSGVGNSEEMINQGMRRKYLALVAAHPGATVEELETAAGGAYARSWVVPALHALLFRRQVTKDDDGRYWVV